MPRSPEFSPEVRAEIFEIIERYSFQILLILFKKDAVSEREKAVLLQRMFAELHQIPQIANIQAIDIVQMDDLVFTPEKMITRAETINYPFDDVLTLKRLNS